MLTTRELKSWDPDICTIWLFVHDEEMVFISDEMCLKIESVQRMFKNKITMYYFLKKIG